MPLIKTSWPGLYLLKLGRFPVLQVQRVNYKVGVNSSGQDDCPDSPRNWVSGMESLEGNTRSMDPRLLDRKSVV